MLTAKEYRLNTLCFEWFSYFCIIPFEIKGLQTNQPTGKRLLFWVILLMAQVCQVVMTLWFMVSKVVAVGLTAIPTIALDFCIIAGTILAMYAGIQNFIRWPEVAQCIWKSVQECDIDKCERKGGIFGYTILEIYTMLLPLGLYPAALALVIAYSAIYIWPMTQGSFVFTRLVLIFGEALIFLSCVSWIHFGLITHITFMEKIGFTFKTQTNHLQHQHLQFDQIQGVQESIQKLRAMQVEMNGFNASQKNIIFAFKLVSMSFTIFCGFAAIQFFYFNLVMGVCNMLVMTEAIFGFAFSYNKGFSIPRSVQSLQRLLVFYVKLNGDVKDRRRMVLLRQIKSVRKMALRVGNFHYLQRVSTPNFVDFCTKNMVRLVMFYRRHSA